MITELSAVDMAHALRFVSVPMTDLAAACATYRDEAYFRAMLEAYGFTPLQADYVINSWYPMFRTAMARHVSTISVDTVHRIARANTDASFIYDKE